MALSSPPTFPWLLCVYCSQKLTLENDTQPTSHQTTTSLSDAMKVSCLHALLVVAASLTAHANADFSVGRGHTIKSATSKHVNYVKQWTLTAGANANSIGSIDLSLAGNAYVTYVSDLPSDVAGYVNVSGDSRATVNAVIVSKDVNNDLEDDSDLDDLFDNDNDGNELNVWLNDKAASGYLLTEIFLASPETVTDVKSQRSAHVVIEDGVLVTDGRKAELQIEASGSSAVYVSAPDAPVSVGALSLDTTGSASIEYNVKSVSVRSDLQLGAQGSSTIAVLSSTVATRELELEARKSASICFSAPEITAKRPQVIQGKTRISMPNSFEMYGTTGSATCEESELPARKAGKIAAASATGSTYTDTDDDLDVDDALDNDNDLDDGNDLD